jgi:hypothetical protein
MSGCLLMKEKLDKEMQTYLCDISSLVSQVETCFAVNIYRYAYDRLRLREAARKTRA